MVGRQQAGDGRTTTAQERSAIGSKAEAGNASRAPRLDNPGDRPSARAAASKSMRATKPALPLGRGGADARTVDNLEPSQQVSRVQALKGCLNAHFFAVAQRLHSLDELVPRS
jgi:hypothetical protein